MKPVGVCGGWQYRRTTTSSMRSRMTSRSASGSRAHPAARSSTRTACSREIMGAGPVRDAQVGGYSRAVRHLHARRHAVSRGPAAVRARARRSSRWSSSTTSRSAGPIGTRSTCARSRPVTSGERDHARRRSRSSTSRARSRPSARSAESRAAAAARAAARGDRHARRRHRARLQQPDLRHQAARGRARARPRPTPKRKRASLELIDDVTERSATLTRSLLGFARRGKHRALPVALDDVVGSMRELLRAHARRASQLEFELDATDRGTVIGDQSQLEQVVMNLVVNARDARAADTGRPRRRCARGRVRGEQRRARGRRRRPGHPARASASACSSRTSRRRPRARSAARASGSRRCSASSRATAARSRSTAGLGGAAPRCA